MSGRRGATPRTRSTPASRTPRGKNAYLPFNARPKEVGSRTGRAMPVSVPMDDDGFEDPNAFFRSDSIASSSPHPTQFITPKGRKRKSDASNSGPSTGPSTRRTRRSGRLSRLVDDEEIVTEVLLEEDDLNITPPGPVHHSSPNPPASLAIPKRSQLPPPSPLNFNYDAVPSPSRKSSSFRKKSILPPAELDEPEDEPEDPEPEEENVEEEHSEEESQPSRKHKGKEKAQRVEPHPDTIPDTYESDDNLPIDIGGDAGDMDDDIGGFDDVNGEGDYGNGYGNDDDSVNLEEHAVQAENGYTEDEDEGEQREETPRLVQRRKKQTKPMTPESPEPNRSARVRISQLPRNDDSKSYEGDFLTKRGRTHIRPLRWWAGERIEWGKGKHQPVIKGIVHKPAETAPIRPKKRGRPPKRQISRPLTPDAEEDEDEEIALGQDPQTNQHKVVINYTDKEEIQRRIALTNDKIAPKPVLGANFMYQKVLGEGKFSAAGFVHLPVGGEKPAKGAGDNSYMFLVVSGLVNVVIHKSSFLMSTGGIFMVPRGNTYSIQNVSPTKEARLFFSQARQVRVGEDDESDADRTPRRVEREEQEPESEEPRRKRRGRPPKRVSK